MISAHAFVEYMRSCRQRRYTAEDTDNRGVGRWRLVVTRIQIGLGYFHFGGRIGFVLLECFIQVPVNQRNIPAVPEAVWRTVGRAEIKALRRLAFINPIIGRTGHFQKEFGRGRSAMLQFGAVATKRNKFRFEAFDHFGIGENGRTVQLAIVSRTTQRMSVHDPHEDGLALNLRFNPGFHDVCEPRNFQIAVLFSAGLDTPDTFI